MKKIAKLNIVEKYIFYKRVYNIRNTKKSISNDDIKEYFEEFLNNEIF